MEDLISWSDFVKIKMRVGTIVSVEAFPEARKPAYQLKIDFGKNIGVRKSSAQFADLYGSEDLIGKQVVGVINFPPKQIGPFKSECLVMGAYNEHGQVVILTPDQDVSNGAVIG